MKHIIHWLVMSVTTMTLVACWTDLPPAFAQAAAPADGSASGITGKVIETMNADVYTYVQVDDGSKKIWAAAPKFTVAVGDKVKVPDGIEMRDFHSKTLNRTFDLVYFVPGVEIVGGKPAGNSEPAKEPPVAAHGGGSPHGGSPHGTTGNPAAAIDLSNIKKADGGHTVAELFANKATLVGKDVAVRGRVVKYTADVMGKNWLHVQDGSGSAGSNDITVSTSSAAAVGNMVLVRGKLGADKDFGFGYHYDVIIEDGSVAVE